MFLGSCFFLVTLTLLQGSSTSTTSSVASRLSALEKEFAALNRTLNGTIMTLINDREVEGRTNKGGQKSGVIPPLYVLNHMDLEHHIYTSAGFHHGESDSNHSRISEWETSVLLPDPKK